MLEIISNSLTVSDVPVGDLSIIVPPAGGVVVLEDTDDIEEASESEDLLDLVSDDAFGTGEHTLRIRLDGQNIPSQDVEARFATWRLPTAGAFSVPAADENGNIPVDETSHKNLNTLTHSIVGDFYAEPVGSGYIIWTDRTKTEKIREYIVTKTDSRVSQVVEIVYELGAEKERQTLVIDRTAGSRPAIDGTTT